MALGTTTNFGMPAPAAGTPAADLDTEFAAAAEAADAALAAALAAKADVGHTHSAYETDIADLQTRTTALEGDVATLQSSVAPVVPQTITHTVAGAVAVDMAAGHIIRLNASADITDFTWPTDPGVDAVASILLINDGLTTITVDITVGFRTAAGDALAPLTVHPGGKARITAMGDDQAWTVADPYVMAYKKLAEGTPASTAVTVHGATGESYGAGQSNMATTVPSSSSGKVAVMVVGGTGGLSGDLGIDGDAVDAPEQTSWTLVDMYSAAWGGVVYTLHRVLDGSAADTPALTGNGTLRSWSIVVLDGTSLAELTYQTWDEHADGLSFASDPATPAEDGSVVMSWCFGQWASRSYDLPANMTALVDKLDTNARGIGNAYTALETATTFTPDPFTITSGNSSSALTRTVTAEPA